MKWSMYESIKPASIYLSNSTFSKIYLQTMDQLEKWGGKPPYIAANTVGIFDGASAAVLDLDYLFIFLKN